MDDRPVAEAVHTQQGVPGPAAILMVLPEQENREPTHLTEIRPRSTRG
ncbi:MAG: hypothetical protein RMN51_04495 [Verrucomicrobiota bacterium]|nr:hypothetical protein [Verrucomicrobiota bacterium]